GRIVLKVLQYRNRKAWERELFVGIFLIDQCAPNEKWAAEVQPPKQSLELSSICIYREPEAGKIVI
ncbi:MAG: hypothetical protein ACRD82_12635, partial [Blastocatellia bacterium]